MRFSIVGLGRMGSNLALDAVQKPLAEMKNYMFMCMNVVSMIQNMHSGMDSSHREGE